ncbi:zinc finger protein RFP-like [Esox lucius]|uniref:zinc finger protein RFP-like n=1 Tax=Esox lucius TaxID=8010 RepID=UPI0014772504|nr:zinc finger protein RFP-like [Esox lucius]
MANHRDFEVIRRHAVDVTLDPDTAHPSLILSEDIKQVSLGDTKQDLPDNPKRFNQVPYVLGRECFSLGKFYFEVKVMGKNRWTLGVARDSINRKGEITERPKDGYWNVGLRYGTYKALNVHPVTLPIIEKPHKVGVFVDYEEGQVSFFNVDARCHIYSFTDQAFSGKLYPIFSPGFIYDSENSAPLVICPVDCSFSHPGL